MSVQLGRGVRIKSRHQWRHWLRKNHDKVREIWLVFFKGDERPKSISYDDALDDALRFGWVDSLVKRLDDRRYARKFTPRKADSRWSSLNRRRYERLKAEGRLAAPGVARPPAEVTTDAPRPTLAEVPKSIVKGLKANAAAWQAFQKLPPSHQRRYLGWIASAKREETQQKRLREAITMLAAGQKLGLK